MFTFVVFAGLMVVLALSYVLPPLLQRKEAQTPDVDAEGLAISIYRNHFGELDAELRDGLLDRQQYDLARVELERRLLQEAAPAGEPAPDANRTQARSDRKFAIAVGAAIPALAVLLYLQIGTPEVINSGRQAAPAAAADDEQEQNTPARRPGAPTQQEIEQRVARLAARLKENPDDAQGWAMLARSYRSFKKYREASDAYERATQLTPNDAQLWADYAESLSLSDDSGFVGRPLEMVNRALRIDPENQKALWLAGNAAFQAKDYRQAIARWEALRKQLPGDSKAAESVSSSIAEARARLSDK